MANLLKVLFVVIAALIAISCGGGGNHSSPILRTDRVFIAPNQSANIVFGDLNINVEAGTFPNGANWVVTQYTHAPFQSGNSNFQNTHSPFSIESDSIADKDVVIELPKKSASLPLVGIKDQLGWAPLRVEEAGNAFRIIVPAASNPERSGRGGLGFLWKIIIGIVKDNLPDTEMGLKLVAGSGSFGDGSAVIVHGFFDNYGSVKRMAEMLMPRMGWRNVYSFAFDWRLPAPEVAEYLGNELDQPQISPKTVALVAHSRGCIISRYAFEIFEKTRTVHTAIFFAGPNTGTKWANAGDIAFNISTLFLNDDYLGPYIGITANDPSIDELVHNSVFLNSLNTYNFRQRGNVDYVFVAGGYDSIVPTESALALNLDVQELTGGTVSRYLIPTATHGSFKNNPDHIEQFLELLGPRIKGIRVTMDPNPVEAVTTGWFSTIEITNVSTQTIKIDNVSFEQFNRYGIWYSTRWYDPDTPGGTPFPNRYYQWNKFIQPGETIEIDVQWRVTDINTQPPQFQAMTSIVRVLAKQQNGVTVSSSEEKLVCYYQDRWPDEPITHQPGQMPIPGGPEVGKAK